MNKNQTKHYEMLDRVVTALDENTSIWSVVPIISKVKDDLEDILHQLDVLHGTTNDNSTVSTKKKENIKKYLQQKVPALAGKFYVYGDMNEDEEIKSISNFTSSSIGRIREQDLYPKMKSLIDLIRKHIAELADYGITLAELDEIENKVSDYKDLIGGARKIRNNVFVHINEIGQLIDEGNAIVRNRLDKLMQMFKETNPAFYDLYKRSRTIID